METKEKAQVDLKDSVSKIKNYLAGLPREKKKRAGLIFGAIILAALGVVLVLNFNRLGYRPLYSNLDSSEANGIYQLLREQGVEAKIDAGGQVLVPRGQYNELLLSLAAQGYPKSGLSYDVFSSHSGMTTTESERKQWLLFQLQDRIQDTLKQMKGVRGAVVTINVPDTSDYVWEQANESAGSSASVLLTLDTALSAEQVSSVKALVAAGVPNLAPEDVKVVDAGTKRELFAAGAGNAEDAAFTSGQNLALEQQVQKQIEDNIVRVLAPRYGSTGVVAVAKVTLDYDKMMTERKELLEKESGGGYPTDVHENYTLDGQVAAGGIVGEENNTDIPDYVYRDPDKENGATDYARDVQFDYGYILTQVEKGNAQLKRATVSVLVDEASLTQSRRQELVELISNSVDIEPAYISVSSIDPNAVEVPEPPAVSFELPAWAYGVAAAGVGAFLLVILLFVLLHRRAKKKERLREEELENSRLNLENEIEAYKQQLSNAAKAGMDPKDDAIMNEVRGFAHQNPEITANLLRSWIKEGGE